MERCSPLRPHLQLHLLLACYHWGTLYMKVPYNLYLLGNAHNARWLHFRASKRRALAIISKALEEQDRLRKYASKNALSKRVPVCPLCLQLHSHAARKRVGPGVACTMKRSTRQSLACWGWCIILACSKQHAREGMPSFVLCPFVCSA